MTDYLMNPFTGSVDTAENWEAEKSGWDTSNGQTPDEQFKTLIPVAKNSEGDWVEV